MRIGGALAIAMAAAIAMPVQRVGLLVPSMPTHSRNFGLGGPRATLGASSARATRKHPQGRRRR